jgi:membrane protein
VNHSKRWLNLAKETAAMAIEDDCLGRAKGAAYSFILFFFPLLLFLVALVVVTDVITLIAEPIKSFLPRVLPRETQALVTGYLQTMIKSEPTHLMVGAFLIMIWTASGMMVTFIEGLNVAYRVPVARSLVKERFVAIGLVFLVGIPLVALALVAIFGSYLESWLMDRFQLTLLWFWKLLRWSVVLVVTMVMISIIYYVGPRRRQTWRGVIPGAALATTIWIVATAAFGAYVSRFGEYNLIYGSIGAAIILLIWMYLSSLAVLIGAEFNAILERSRSRGGGC